MPDGEEAPISLEEKLNTIMSKLTELEDLQLVNKLDIINLKNEIEKLKLTTSVPSPETIEKIRELGKFAEHVGEFRELKNLADNMDKIMAEIKKTSSGGLEDMIKVVDDIDKRVRKIETQGLGMKPEEAEEYAKSVEGLKSGLKSLPKGAKGVLGLSKQMEKLRLMVEENTKNIWKLKTAKPREAVEPEKPKVIERPPVKKPAKPVAVECSKCGAELPSHAKFCRKCGVKVK